MNPENENILTIAYINVHGQSNLSEAKQSQLEDFIKYNKIDIAHLQETETCDTTFSNCNFISSTFNLYSNNAANKYGTSSLVKNVFTVENLKYDTSGRALVFDIGDLTFGNFYGHSGTDAKSRAKRGQKEANRSAVHRLEQLRGKLEQVRDIPSIKQLMPKTFWWMKKRK